MAISDRMESRACVLVVENGYSKQARFSVLDAVWPTVAAALRQFFQEFQFGKLSVLDSV